jgi:hypothetical protein
MSSNNQGQTGPKSIAGKRKSSMNALKSGMFAKTPVLPFEDEAQYRRHVKAVMTSLDPEDAVQVSLAQQIADSMWRGQRQEYRAALERDEVFKTLTPSMMVDFLGLKGVLAKYPPRFLVTPNFKVSSKEVKEYKKLHQHYEHFVANSKGVPNYNMIWRQYPDLFVGLEYWMSPNHPPLFMANRQGLDLHWQNHPRKLEDKMDQYGALCWYLANFEDLRAQIRNWMGIWFFLKGRDSERVERFDDRVLQERKTCLHLLDSFFRMRKSQIDHVLFTERRLKVSPPKSLDDIVLPHEIPRVSIGKNEMGNLTKESTTC